MKLRVIAQTINPIFSSSCRDQHTIMAFLGLAATTDTPMRSAAALALEVLPRSATAKVESALKESGQTLPQKESAINESDIEDRPDLNACNKWSELDLFAFAKHRQTEHPIE